MDLHSKAIQIILTGSLLLILSPVQSIQAQGDTTTTMINKVNQLRIGKGLDALLPDPALMAAAAQQSQYLASIGEETDTGPDGSTPAERAQLAGFAPGAQIQILEGEACISEGTFEEVLAPEGEDPLEIILNPEVKFIGAGLAYGGDLTCYVVLAGTWEGEPGPTRTASPTASGATSSALATEVPIVVSTPLPDGTVKHIVAGGQTLWTIADVYNISLEELRALNQFEPDQVVNLGDVVIVHPSYTPTNTPIGKPSPTLPPRYTHTPSPVGFQGTAVVMGQATESPTPEGPNEPRFQTRTKNPLIVITAVLISGATLAAALAFSLRNKQ